MKLINLKFLLLFFCIALLGAVFISFFYVPFMVVDVQNVPMKVKVIETTGKAGFDTNSSVLAFGTLSSGTSSTRQMVLHNDHGERLRVLVYSEDMLGEWVTYSEDSFILESGEGREISIRMHVPQRVVPGNYSGDVVFLFKRVLI